MNVRVWELGSFPPKLAATLLDRLPAPFLGGEIAGERLPAEAAYDRTRAQFDAVRLLAAVPQAEPGWLHLAVTGLDLFLPALTYVFGVSELGRGRSVVSVFRLQPDLDGSDADRLLHRRLVVEAVHELGHSMGLVHCPVSDCAMRRSAWVEAVDLKRPAYCSACLELCRRGMPTPPE